MDSLIVMLMMIMLTTLPSLPIPASSAFVENVKPVDQSIITNNSKAGNLTAANTLNPITDVNALDNQGNNLSSHGRFDLAITFYDKALALDPSNLKVLIHKADSLSKLRKYEDAVKTYIKPGHPAY